MSPLPPFRFSWFWDFFSVLENHFAKSVDESSHLKARSKNPLASLLEEVEGSKMVVPRLEELSPAWTMSTNPHLRSISDEFQSWVDV